MDETLPFPLAAVIKPTESHRFANTEEIKGHRKIEQVIAASPEDVFDAWVTPEILEQWWGPDGFTTRVLEMNAAEGGNFVFEMTAPDGSCCEMTGIYRKIDRPNLLIMEVLDHCNLSLPPHVKPQRKPSLVSVEISQYGTSTRVQVSHTLLDSSYEWLAVTSWSSVLKKLNLRVSY